MLFRFPVSKQLHRTFQACPGITVAHILQSLHFIFQRGITCSQRQTYAYIIVISNNTYFIVSQCRSRQTLCKIKCHLSPIRIFHGLAAIQYNDYLPGFILQTFLRMGLHTRKKCSRQNHSQKKNTLPPSFYQCGNLQKTYRTNSQDHTLCKFFTGETIQAKSQSPGCYSNNSAHNAKFFPLSFLHVIFHTFHRRTYPYDQQCR